MLDFLPPQTPVASVRTAQGTVMPEYEHRREPPSRPPLERVGGRLDGHDTDELLVAAGRGDLHALAAFYDKTAPVVYGLLCGMLGGHPTRAEQATQRVYLQLWLTAPGFEPTERSAYALLLRTTCRELIDQVQEMATRNRDALRCGKPATPAGG